MPCLRREPRIARSTKPRIDIYLYLSAQVISTYLHRSIRVSLKSLFALRAAIAWEIGTLWNAIETACFQAS
ncbi:MULTISPECIES: hypothetical protein [unclassified Microcoleus]|uniref:hypothetical protein n=1 Tax=unclassified Microcoleus TaxID=2642155 RepID=UPI002FD586EA